MLKTFPIQRAYTLSSLKTLLKGFHLNSSALIEFIISIEFKRVVQNLSYIQSFKDSV